MSDLSERIKVFGKTLTAGGIVSIGHSTFLLTGRRSSEIFIPNDLAIERLVHELNNWFSDEQVAEIKRLCRLCGDASINPPLMVWDYLGMARDWALLGDDYDTICYELWQRCTYHPQEELRTAEPEYDGCFFK